MYTKEQWEERKKEYLRIFEKNHALVALSAEELGVSPNQIYVWKKEDPEFAQAMLDIEEAQVDKVESKLLEHIENGDIGSCQFYLRNRSTKYKEKQEVKVTVENYKLTFDE